MWSDTSVQEKVGLLGGGAFRWRNTAVIEHLSQLVSLRIFGNSSLYLVVG